LQSRKSKNESRCVATEKRREEETQPKEVKGRENHQRAKKKKKMHE